MERNLPKFSDYDQFWHFYLQQHSRPLTKTLHVVGLATAIAFVIGAFAAGHPAAAPLGLVLGYGFAWSGHFFVEKNVPATFGHPWWSLVSDFRMAYGWLTGRFSQTNT